MVEHMVQRMVQRTVQRVEFEPDAPPSVRIAAQVLEHALGTPAGAALLKGQHGQVALTSPSTQQTITLNINANRIVISRGLDRPDVSVSTDLADPGANPQVRSAWRRPGLARRIRQLLMLGDPDWQEAAHRFWQRVHGMPGHPAGLHITCTDNGESLDLGEAAEVILEGSARPLSHVMCGRSILMHALVRKMISARGSMAHLALLSDATIGFLLDDFDEASDKASNE
ncbi:MAG: hypothetical protein O2780_03275 [Proteobacteria bacterium]|jgi:hypothetical protein|nr:hypothetical protein [Pseudomonadota bacterium]MDA1299568.1 hypothetical protein [Pseudomonadota bacterium]